MPPAHLYLCFFGAGSIRKIPYPELNFPPQQRNSSSGTSGTPAVRADIRTVFSGCPQGDDLVSRPPFDLMVFVSPEYNVFLVKAIIEWVSTKIAPGEYHNPPAVSMFPLQITNPSEAQASCQNNLSFSWFDSMRWSPLTISSCIPHPKASTMSTASVTHLVCHPAGMNFDNHRASLATGFRLHPPTVHTLSSHNHRASLAIGFRLSAPPHRPHPLPTQSPSLPRNRLHPSTVHTPARPPHLPLASGPALCHCDHGSRRQYQNSSHAFDAAPTHSAGHTLAARLKVRGGV